MAAPITRLGPRSCGCKTFSLINRTWLLWRGYTTSSPALRVAPGRTWLLWRGYTTSSPALRVAPGRTARTDLFNRAFLLCHSKLIHHSQDSHKGCNSVLFRRFSTSLQCLSNSLDADGSHLPVFLQAEKYLDNTAVIDGVGSFSYADILHHSMKLATQILTLKNCHHEMKLGGDRVALLTEQDVCYVMGQYATWIANGISVPLCASHPPPEWEYFLQDSRCSLVLVSEGFAEKISPIAHKLDIPIKILSRSHFSEGYEKNRWFQPDFASNPKKVARQYVERKKRWFDRQDQFVQKRPALIIYTSGTTGPPKGVVLTHGNLSAMTRGMIKSWEWTARDTVLHVLPLHHVHGVVNVLLTPLACGAACVMAPRFDAAQVWQYMTTPSSCGFGRTINLFMAVPTVYAKLIQYFQQHIETEETTFTQDFVHETLARRFRLMVSGSAALPQPISDRWLEISGHRLLERYGMTEIGMALTNPLHGPRVPGAVGNPFPEVEVCISKPNVYSPRGYDVVAEGNSKHTVVHRGMEGEIGDLLVRGSSVFLEYWDKPKVTEQSFTKDGWFKTGDTAVYKDGSYRIVGRTSVDVIKSGGYKISALDVERHLLAHPDIMDCAVVGLPDITWGQKVAAVLVTGDGKSLDLSELREWGAQRLPSYQLPTVVKVLDSLPRNAMGKVNKKELTRDIFPEYLTRSIG